MAAVAIVFSSVGMMASSVAGDLVLDGRVTYQNNSCDSAAYIEIAAP